MQIKEFIEELQELLDKHGNIEVSIQHYDGYGFEDCWSYRVCGKGENKEIVIQIWKFLDIGLKLVYNTPNENK